MLSSYGDQLRKDRLSDIQKTTSKYFFHGRHPIYSSSWMKIHSYRSQPLRIESWPRSSLEITFDSSGNHVGEGRRARNTKIRVDPKRHWRNFQQDYEGREEIGNPRKMNSWGEGICLVKFQGWTMTRSVVGIPRISRFEGNGCLERLKASAAAMRVHSTCETWEISTRSLNLVYFLNPWFRK